MVKADLTRDYYSDLEIAPGADVLEIKKQFKRLALNYHPDRNPGRESEVTAKFQKIQSAHEVLIDPQERARYDANRIRGGSRYGGMSSGVRGNPWSNVASQYPTPPKAPTARQRPPAPSTGARRYEKFTTPNPSAYQASQEGPQARKDTYEAWEKVRNTKAASGDASTGPGKSWKTPQPPPRGTPQSGREESNARKHAPPSRAAPGFEEFREANNPRRSHSTNTANRKGFMPNTPGGGDEPPAPMGAYFTERNKPTAPGGGDEPPAPMGAYFTERKKPTAPGGGDEPPAAMGAYFTERKKPTAPPEVPLREPPEQFARYPSMRERPQSSRAIPNPLKQFQDKPMGNEPRISTPYATHGGEKLNPFDSTNINRSKSTRERRDESDCNYIPRTGSDSNLKSPQRARSSAQRSPPRFHKPSFTETVNLDASSEESSSDGFVQMNPRSRVPQTDGASNGTTNGYSKDGPSASKTDTNGQAPPSARPQTEPQQQPIQPNGESMYAYSNFSNFVKSERQRVPNFSVKLPTVSETIRSEEDNTPKHMPSECFTDARPVTPPSGFTSTPGSLNAFEGLQRNLVDQLLTNKGSGNSGGKKSDSKPDFALPCFRSTSHGWANAWTEYRNSTSTTPSKEFKPVKHLHTVHSSDHARTSRYYEEYKEIKSQANPLSRASRFSFNINDETFNRTRHQSNGFSNSAENISTKFTPEDWEGKFEAGADYFKPDAKTRTQSTSRPRGRSPVKIRPVDAQFGQARVESETAMESPGGTKFSAEEWTETFKPQTFMPTTINSQPRMATTPGRKRTGPTIRPTMGTAAVVDDGNTSDEKPLFTGRKNMRSMASSPEPMDIDTPPAYNTVPQYATTPNGHLNVNTEPLNRAATASQSPTDTEGLKVNFDDLTIKDLMSTLALPTPPHAPQLPLAPNEFERPTRASYDDYLRRYEKYMGEWDIFNSKYLLHMVARRRQNDTLKEKRWTDAQGTEIYRLGLKEDQAVLKRWGEMQEMHGLVVKSFVVIRERMKTREEREGVPVSAKNVRVRPRKKTH